MDIPALFDFSTKKGTSIIFTTYIVRHKDTEHEQLSGKVVIHSFDRYWNQEIIRR